MKKMKLTCFIAHELSLSSRVFNSELFFLNMVFNCIGPNFHAGRGTIIVRPITHRWCQPNHSFSERLSGCFWSTECHLYYACSLLDYFYTAKMVLELVHAKNDFMQCETPTLNFEEEKLHMWLLKAVWNTCGILSRHPYSARCQLILS